MLKKQGKRERALRDMKAWCNDPINREFCFDEPRGKLREYLDGGDVSIGVLAQRLNGLSSWYSATAILQAEAGLAEWATNIHNAHSCDWIALASLARASDEYPVDRRAVISANDASYALARAGASGSIRDAEGMYRVLMARIPQGTVGLSQTRLAPFVLRMFGDWLNEGTLRLQGLKTVSDPTYERILTVWRSEDIGQVEAALLQGCELHMARAADHTAKDTFEFWELSSRLYAAEILLVMQLRRLVGLKQPRVEHPLLCGELGAPLEVGAMPGGDDLLADLRRQLSQRVPELFTEA